MPRLASSSGPLRIFCETCAEMTCMTITNHPKPVYAGPTAPSSLHRLLDEDQQNSHAKRSTDGWLVRVLRRLFD